MIASNARAWGGLAIAFLCGAPIARPDTAADAAGMLARLAAPNDGARRAARSDLGAMLVDPGAMEALLEAAPAAAPESRLALRAAVASCPACGAILHRLAATGAGEGSRAAARALLEELLLAEIGRRVDPTTTAKPDAEQDAWFEPGTLTGLPVAIGAPPPLWAVIDRISAAVPGRRPLAFDPALGDRIDAMVPPEEIAAGTAASIVEGVLSTRGLVIEDRILVGLIVAEDGVAADGAASRPARGANDGAVERAAARRLTAALCDPAASSDARDALFRALHLPGAAELALARSDAALAVDAGATERELAVRAIGSARTDRERVAWALAVARDARNAAATGAAAITDAGPDVRAVGAWLLGRGRDVASRTALEAALADPDPIVRAASLSALVEVDPSSERIAPAFAALAAGVDPRALRRLVAAAVVLDNANRPLDPSALLASADAGARALGAAMVAVSSGPFEPRVQRITGDEAAGTFASLAPASVVAAADPLRWLCVEDSRAPAALAVGAVRRGTDAADEWFAIARARAAGSAAWRAAATLNAVLEIPLDGSTSRAGFLALSLSRASAPDAKAAAVALKGMLREESLGARTRPLREADFPPLDGGARR